ncbi:MAG: hypothetical protein AAFU73_17560 [Planctomycetota bacterium]
MLPIRANRPAFRPADLGGTALLAALAASSCAPSAPAGTPPEGAPLASFTQGVNQGTLTLDDFQGVQVPLPPHPLGRDEITLAARGETFFAMGQTNASYMTAQPRYVVPSFVADDEGAGYGVLPSTVDDLAAGPGFIDVASGQFDADAADELIGVSLNAAFSGLVLHLGELDPAGAVSWTVIGERSIPALSRIVTVDVETGDFDEDGRDEIVLMAGRPSSSAPVSVMEVLDDPAAGLGPMLETVRSAAHVRMTPLVGDFNADSVDDIVLLLLGTTAADYLYSFRVFLGSRGAQSLAMSNDWVGRSSGSDARSFKFAVGNFDGLPGDEVAAVATRGWSGGFQGSASTSGVRLDLYKYSSASSMERVGGSVGTFSIPSRGGFANTYVQAVTSVDRFGDGVDEIAYLTPDGGQYAVHLFEWDGDTTSYGHVSVPTGLSTSDYWFGFASAGIQSGDTDADGKEELSFALGRNTGGIFQRMAPCWMESGDSLALHFGAERQYDLLFDDGAFGHRPIVVTGDLDADGLVVRTTGRSQLSVSDPVPIALLTAAPTQTGIAQNYGATSTSFAQSDSSTQSFGVTAQVTWSASLGYEVSDMTDFFGASARASVSGALARTDTQESTTTFSTVYSAGADADLLHFQALLYRSHEYEVLAANEPGIVGGYITLDVPLGASEYLWTTDFYNQTVEPGQRIDPALLSHTVGDVASYPARATLEQRVQDNVGWANPTRMTVAQGATSSSGLSIALSTQATTETQREQSVTAEVEFKAGGVTVGASVGATGGETYSVTTSEETEYGGTVGGVVDFLEWQYRWGLCVYQWQRPADPATNEPLEGAPAARPLTVIGYWTEPLGSSF